MAKRLSTIRQGIRFQDLVAAEALLDMVNGELDRPVSVALEDRRGGSFDDVVVRLSDRVVWKQIKWAKHPGAEPLTIESLAASEGKKRSPIRKFADSFTQISKQRWPFELELVTNRSPDPELRGMLTGTKSMLSSKLSKLQSARIVDAWLPASGLSKRRFNEMMTKLSFVVNSPDIETRTKNVRTQLRLMGCPESSFNTLLDSIWMWSQDDGKEVLVSADIDQLLGPVSKTPPNEFQLPTIRLDRPAATEQLLRKLEQHGHGYVVVLGAPGSGKSTLLNTIREQHADARFELIIYNCFTGTADSFLRTRARTENFSKYLINQLHDRFGVFGLRYDPAASIEALLARVSNLLSHRKLTIVVDGLDYATRYAPKDADALATSLPPNLPSNVMIIVSAQVREQLPLRLRSLESSRYFDVPPLNDGEVESLLATYGALKTKGDANHDKDQIVNIVCDITQGHALHVSYVASQLIADIESALNPIMRLAKMTGWPGGIEDYYRTLFAPPETALARDVVSLMASCSFPLSVSEVATLLVPTASQREVEDSLRPFHYLFRCVGGQFHFMHDSLRAYAERQLNGAALTAPQQITFLSSLSQDSRQGDFLLHLWADSPGCDELSLHIDCDWLSRQISAGSNPTLLNDGLTRLAIAALRRQNWSKVVRNWTLQSCLQRAEIEGDLTEPTLINVWLAMKRVSLVERYLFVSGHFLTQTYPGPDLLDLLDMHEMTELASRFRDRYLSRSAPRLDVHDVVDEFGTYVRHASRRIPCTELWPLICARVDAEEESKAEDDLPPIHHASWKLPRYVESIIGECLFARDLSSTEDWLSIGSNLLSTATWSRQFLRLRLLRADLQLHTKLVRKAIKSVEDFGVLKQLAEAGGFNRELSNRLRALELNPLLRNAIAWFESHQVGNAIVQLIRDVELCLALNDQNRLDEMCQSTASINCRVGRIFALAIIQLIEAVAIRPQNWRPAASHFALTIRSLANSTFTINDIRAAQAFVSRVGNIFGSAARSAKASSAEAEFGQFIESTLVPALYVAKINYEIGRLSLADMLRHEQMCSSTVSRLLSQVESDISDDTSFKSTSFSNLAAMYAQNGDLPAANRSLIAGVRSAFTYGYSKDTTINDFLTCFDAVAPHLGNTRFAAAAKFASQAFCVLDDLTDKKMLHFSTSYLIGLVCQYDVFLAATLAQSLWKQCRSLQPMWIFDAASDRGLNLAELTEVFSLHAPDVKLSPENDSGEELETRYSPPEFVTSDEQFCEPTAPLFEEVERAIAKSGFASGFYKMPGLTKALLSRGEITAAVEVFNQFERALRELLQPYRLPEV